jgi:hypothetical protein
VGTGPATGLSPFPSNVVGTVGRRHRHVVRWRMDGLEIGGCVWRAGEGRRAAGSRGRLMREVGTGPGKREEGGGDGESRVETRRVERRWQPVQQQIFSLSLAPTLWQASNSRSRDGQRGRAGQLTLLTAPPSEAYGILALRTPSRSSRLGIL